MRFPDMISHLTVNPLACKVAAIALDTLSWDSFMFSVFVPSGPCEALLAYIHVHVSELMKFHSSAV